MATKLTKKQKGFVQQVCASCEESFQYEKRNKIGRKYCDNCKQTADKKRQATLKRLGNVCLLCNENRILERAHILPRRFVSGIGGLERLESHDDDNIILLCPTHHWCYDHFLLSKEESKVVVDNTIHKLRVFLEAILSLKAEDDKGNPAPKDHPKWKQALKIQTDVRDWLRKWSAMN